MRVLLFPCKNLRRDELMFMIYNNGSLERTSRKGKVGEGVMKYWIRLLEATGDSNGRRWETNG
jgi:hypothetical protein